MILLPGLDVQQGAMTFGQWAKGRYAYYAGVFNGNGRQGDNYRDNNSQKNVQGRFAWKTLAAKNKAHVGHEFWSWRGLDRELGQTLDLRTLGGSRIVHIERAGRSGGLFPDVFCPCGNGWKFGGEALLERFNISAPTFISGGSAKSLWNVFKTEKGMGFSPL